MAGCPDNPSNVDFMSERNMAVHSNGEHDDNKSTMTFEIIFFKSEGGFGDFLLHKFQPYFLKTLDKMEL